MNCKEMEALIPAYVDGEVDPLRGYLIKRHLNSCPDCAATHARLTALRADLHAQVPYYGAPPALRARARDILATPPAPAVKRREPEKNRWTWATFGAAAGCAATVFAWFVGTAVLDLARGNDIVADAVSRHTQATLAQQSIQVATSDQHTVKPWLSARLDYSPPVPDLASEGFTLVGGRLDQLDRRSVATLVYRYHQHTIDVFVRPEAMRAPVLTELRGFNVAHATGAGMDWLAVSDVSPDVLSAFVKRLSRDAGSSDLRK